MHLLDEDAVADRAARLAGAWRERGLAPGDRVAVRAGNGLDFVAARDAATALRLVFVPLNPRLAPPEIEHALAVSGARLTFNDGDPGGPPLALERGGAGATILFTSGTTGRPKGCLRPEAAEAARLAEMTATYGLSAADVHLVVCPLAHSAPGALLRAARAAGARTVIHPRFDAPAFLAARATVVFLVPTQVERILAHGGPAPPSLRAVIVAGAPFAPATRARFAAWLGPGRLWEFYGSSETGTISVLPPGAPPGPPGFVGWPPPGVEVRLAGDGELQIRSPSCMAGYLGEPPVAPGAFISPGDVGALTEDGGVILVDRKGDLIITGGVNVYPAEVERAILEHPAARGAVVFGRPHAEWGEEVCALVTAEVGEEELRAFLRGRIAAFKIPRQIVFVAAGDLPLGPSGKPLRRLARSRLG